MPVGCIYIYGKEFPTRGRKFFLPDFAVQKKNLNFNLSCSIARKAQVVFRRKKTKPLEVDGCSPAALHLNPTTGYGCPSSPLPCRGCPCLDANFFFFFFFLLCGRIGSPQLGSASMSWTS